MKIGIIIIFYNNALDINENLFEGVSKLEKIQLCLVNNGSKDETLEKLQELIEVYELKNSIVDIKQNKGNDMAIKAGVRYLFNENNLKHIGYININKFNKTMSLFELLKAMQNHNDLIIQHKIRGTKKCQKQKSLAKNIFSIMEYLSHLNIKLESTQVNVIGS
ncbi:hypothetical protein A8C32_01515 [Flavivirga aquatica]|uniref:Glycosyltransferase 2-like domain-containing protein n=1 Tax=Flavivirga aquatica TaxID=1849968 RepID=A0A1E5TA25_9FLAO|nr:glycosyltransferase [Flavivirga aquatica]OEK08167.1 hypothetical protein A8C32_01515 [Flavivirga aquatica]